MLVVTRIRKGTRVCGTERGAAIVVGRALQCQSSDARNLNPHLEPKGAGFRMKWPFKRFSRRSSQSNASPPV